MPPRFPGGGREKAPPRHTRAPRAAATTPLLDETTLPMTEIAMRAGFGSLRRFNSVFAEVYGRPPSKIRRARAARGFYGRGGQDYLGAAGLPRRPGPDGQPTPLWGRQAKRQPQRC